MMLSEKLSRIILNYADATWFNMTPQGTMSNAVTKTSKTAVGFSELLVLVILGCFFFGITEIWLWFLLHLIHRHNA